MARLGLMIAELNLIHTSVLQEMLLHYSRVCLSRREHPCNMSLSHSLRKDMEVTVA
jgi:hypothetical protein